MKTTELSGMTFKVDTNGDIYQDGVKLKQYDMGKNYQFTHARRQDGSLQLIPVHRIIAKAYCKIPEGQDYETLQVDHIDSNPENNAPSNLRWVTRKQNNSTFHARKAKSEHARCTQHKFELLTDGTNYFNTYNEAARHYGVTPQTIIGRVQYANTRRKMQWVPMSEVPEDQVAKCKTEFERSQEQYKKARKQKSMNLNIKLSKDRMRIWANHAVVEANNERLCCWRSMSDAKKAQTSLKPCQRNFRKLAPEEKAIWESCDTCQDAITKTNALLNSSFETRFIAFMQGGKTTGQILDFIKANYTINY